jgi:hypothetical protein
LKKDVQKETVSNKVGDAFRPFRIINGQKVYRD